MSSDISLLLDEIAALEADSLLDAKHIRDLSDSLNLCDAQIDKDAATITELTEKLHYNEISHLQADERITELEAFLAETESRKVDAWEYTDELKARITELTDDRRRLVEHSTILGEHIRGEVTDDINDAFRALPDHLQIMIGEEEDSRAALKQED